MKVPNIFVPEKSLDEKTEELKEYKNEESTELTSKEFMKNDTRILYGHTKENQQGEILKNAIDKIVNDTFESKITWEKDPNDYPNITESYRTKATILNHEGKKITIPVLFQVDNEIGFRWGYLYLGGRKGDKTGPCMNTNYEKVRELAAEYFKIDFRALPK